MHFFSFYSYEEEKEDEDVSLNSFVVNLELLLTQKIFSLGEIVLTELTPTTRYLAIAQTMNWLSCLFWGEFHLML